MSIAVALDELADAIAGYGFAYLVTLSGSGRTHVVAVSPTAGPDGLRVADLGRTTVANVGARSAVTLVWPPADIRGHSLIVDGTGHLDGACVVVEPQRAVLHRPAPAPEPSASASGCDSDCVEIPLAARP